MVAPIDFAALRAGTVDRQEVANALTIDDLRQAVTVSIQTMLTHIATCTDADVTTALVDPEATEEVKNADGEPLGWTITHIIVHATATGEASAFGALELARSIDLQRTSRYEVPWTTLTTVEQCRQRLNESLRMRLASLDAWPNSPNLDNSYTPFPGAGNLNAKGLFVLGLVHEDIHQEQLAKWVRQLHAS